MNIRKHICGLLVTVFVLCVPSVSVAVVPAVESEGLITAIRSCNTTGTGWKTFTVFKVADDFDGETWYGLYTKWNGTTYATHPYNAMPEYSLVMMAHSARLRVKVRASYAATSLCGIPDVTMYWDTAGDYIETSN